MSCSSSRKGMHGGGSMEFWREYIGGNSLQLLEVIYRGIELAKIDYPDKFLAERDCIAQNLFSSHPNLNKKQHSKEEEEEEEEEEVVVSNCSRSKKATIATAIEESKGVRGGVGAVAVERVDESQSLHRPPTVTIRCKVRTTTDHQKGSISMRGIQEKQHPRPPQSAVLKPAKSIHHHQPPTVVPANNHRDLLDKKVYEATKRKLREAYEEEDRTKRIRRTHLLDSSEAAKLLHRNNLPRTATAHQLTNNASRKINNNNTSTTWATRRSR